MATYDLRSDPFTQAQLRNFRRSRRFVYYLTESDRGSSDFRLSERVKEKGEESQISTMNIACEKGRRVLCGERREKNTPWTSVSHSS
ncbi:hypothetical protein Nepgr_005629 [Nepenthes gracilis]|uniref:Uncharacterized protein n=1 Tax=Nepenthes gracilis TaxID=150966 RepID=A0AAD3S3I3_NEPGR|nr:hypothetical protein Nepgr_005629 [Nepenthes gracilis]